MAFLSRFQWIWRNPPKLWKFTIENNEIGPVQSVWTGILLSLWMFTWTTESLVKPTIPKRYLNSKLSLWEHEITTRNLILSSVPCELCKTHLWIAANLLLLRYCTWYLNIPSQKSFLWELYKVEICCFRCEFGSQTPYNFSKFPYKLSSYSHVIPCCKALYNSPLCYFI